MTQPAVQFDATPGLHGVVAAHARAAQDWLVAALKYCAEQADRRGPEAAAGYAWEPVGAADVEAAARELERFVASHADIPFERMARSFELSAFEHDLLLLCVAVERSPDEFHDLLRLAQAARKTPYPTFALAHKLFGADDRAALLPHRPLRQFRLLEIFQPADQGLSISALRADEHIVAFAEGELSLYDAPRLDSMLALYVRPAPPVTADSLPPSHREVVDRLAEAWEITGARQAVASAMYFSGPDPTGKLEIAAAAAGAVGRRLFVLSSDQLPAHPGDVDTLATLWKRDSLLYRLALYIDHGHAGPATGEAGSHRAVLARLLASLREFGPVVLATREPWPAGESAVAFEIEKPRRAEQRNMWIEHLPATLDVEVRKSTAAALAWQFNLDARTIARVAPRAAEALPTNGTPLPSEGKDDTAARLRGHLWGACRTASRPGLEGLARRVQAKARWDDIVLPREQFQLLKQIAAQVDSRGRVYHDWGFADRCSRGLGIAALFAGESGTGKTMAAEVIATHLDLDLYRIDLSAVVSKYIGETEKNLRRLFDGAEDGGAILLFDEADALFGKRSEVKDSHDRYSNIEINYLLQRMEAYRGLAILATNMKSALDSAFLRRLRFTVHFKPPTLEDQQRIWAKVFPPKMLKALGDPSLDYARLARLQLTGGHIYSIALNTAFLAADGARPLTTELVLSAARDEFIKMGRPIHESDFAYKTPPEAARGAA